MTRMKQGLIRVLDKAATGIGSVLNVENYRDVVFQLTSTTSANLTVKWKASISAAQPDFSAAVSATNQWFYVQSKDLDTAATYNGSTGIVISSDTVVGGEINTNYIKWLCPQVTAYSAGHVYVDVNASNDTNY